MCSGRRGPHIDRDTIAAGSWPGAEDPDGQGHWSIRGLNSSYAQSSMCRNSRVQNKQPICPRVPGMFWFLGAISGDSDVAGFRSDPFSPGLERHWQIDLRPNYLYWLQNVPGSRSKNLQDRGEGLCPRGRARDERLQLRVGVQQRSDHKCQQRPNHLRTKLLCSLGVREQYLRCDVQHRRRPRPVRLYREWCQDRAVHGQSVLRQRRLGVHGERPVRLEGRREGRDPARPALARGNHAQAELHVLFIFRSTRLRERRAFHLIAPSTR